MWVEPMSFLRLVQVLFASVRTIEMRAIGLVSFEIGHSEFAHLESLVLDGLSKLTRFRIGEGNAGFLKMRHLTIFLT